MDYTVQDSAGLRRDLMFIAVRRRKKRERRRDGRLTAAASEVAAVEMQ
jgi:hypothetical protein